MSEQYDRRATARPQEIGPLKPSAATAATVARVRRPLGNLDVNRLATATPLGSHGPPASATKSQLTGHKRKMKVEESDVHAPTPAQTAQVLLEREQRLRRENIAWLDMLLYLLERKYGAYAAPVALEELEEAHILDAVYRGNRRAEQDSTSAAAAGASTLHVRGPNAAAADTGTSEAEERERDLRRQRILYRHAVQIQENSVSSTTSCGCKTGCLKMYCVCFSSRGFCHPDCSCEDCKNTRINKDQRLTAIQSYLANDRRAFSFASQVRVTSKSGFLHLLPQKSSTVVLRGCRCKKSKCLKKYCECYQNGIPCTSHCRCVDCSNHADASVHPNAAGQATSQTTAASSSSTGNAAGSSSAQLFHAVQVSVTKKPRTNLVQRSVRMRL